MAFSENVCFLKASAISNVTDHDVRPNQATLKGREMPKFKQPLSQNRFHQWGMNISRAGDIDPNALAKSLASDVKNCMENQYGIIVNANKTDITIGGLLSSKTFPGVEFSFAGHTDWARYLVGISKTAAILAVDIVQQGSPSSAMQRMNSAESKGMFSITGALQKAVTDQNAVEEEGVHYGALLQTIQQVVESWTK